MKKEKGQRKNPLSTVGVPTGEKGKKPHVGGKKGLVPLIKKKEKCSSIREQGWDT